MRETSGVMLSNSPAFVPANPADVRFRRGWQLVAAAGVFPACAGLGNLAAILAGAFPEPAQDAAFWRMTAWMFGVNLAMSGIFITALAVFALRQGERWAWWLLLGALLWVGVNDTVCLTRFRMETGSGFPVAAIPTCLGLAGLALARRRR